MARFDLCTRPPPSISALHVPQIPFGNAPLPPWQVSPSSRGGRIRPPCPLPLTCGSSEAHGARFRNRVFGPNGCGGAADLVLLLELLPQVCRLGLGVLHITLPFGPPQMPWNFRHPQRQRGCRGSTGFLKLLTPLTPAGEEPIGVWGHVVGVPWCFVGRGSRRGDGGCFSPFL